MPCQIHYEDHLETRGLNFAGGLKIYVSFDNVHIGQHFGNFAIMQILALLSMVGTKPGQSAITLITMHLCVRNHSTLLIHTVNDGRQLEFPFAHS
jgi:hypothetical protein